MGDNPKDVASGEPKTPNSKSTGSTVNFHQMANLEKHFASSQQQMTNANNKNPNTSNPSILTSQGNAS